MKAIILAGGLGSRLKPFTEIIPKPLLPVGKKSVLEVQIERLKMFGINEIILATNYKSEYLESFFGDGERLGVKLKISKETKPLGTAGPIKLLERELYEPFIVMNGDILSLTNYKLLYDYALSKKTLLTITIKKIITPYDFGNILFSGDYVTNITEKPKIISYALAGIYVMKPEILDLIPFDTYFGMDQLIMEMLKNDLLISKYDLKEYWLDIGRVEDYEKAQTEYYHQLSEIEE